MTAKLISFLLDHNKRQSEEFLSPDASLQRRIYRAKHPTEIAVLKCMDGRLHLAVTTKTPLGIIQPFRTIGGKFDMGDQFGQTFNEWVSYATSRGRKCLVLVTYHYSKGDHHRGCAGHGYDTDGARAYATALKAKIEEIYGKRHTVVHPILAGIETDEDTLVLHGEDGATLDLSADAQSLSEAALRQATEALYPDMEGQMLHDLMPLLHGNVRHIAEVRAAKRPISDAEHKEQIIAVGRGFDWLHLYNKALIVGPYSYDLAAPVGVAGKVVLGNLKAGRIPDAEGIVLLTSAIYRDEAGPDRLRAAEKAKTLAKISLAALERDVPELMPKVHLLVGTVNMKTRLFTPVDVDLPHAFVAAKAAKAAEPERELAATNGHATH